MATVGDLAGLFDVSPQTIRTWTAEFGDFLSPGATPASGEVRRFSQEDELVMATVARLRDDHVSYDDIRIALAAGERETWETDGRKEEEDQAPTALSARLMTVVSRYEGKLEATEEALEYTRRQLEEERAARLEAEKRAAKLEGQLQAAMPADAESDEERPWWAFWNR